MSCFLFGVVCVLPPPPPHVRSLLWALCRCCARCGCGESRVPGVGAVRVLVVPSPPSKSLVPYGPQPTGGGGGGGAGRGGPESIEFQVPNDKVGLVIGRMGATVKGVQDRTGTHVQIPKEADAADRSVRTLVVSGRTRASVEEAKAEILALLSADNSQRGGGFGGGGGGGGGPGHHSTTIVVPNDRVGLVIGKGGSTIQELQSRTGESWSAHVFRDPTVLCPWSLFPLSPVTRTPCTSFACRVLIWCSYPRGAPPCSVCVLRHSHSNSSRC
jgi:predicted RNA-binding protein YlqC (UPF0109 family)